MIGSSFCLYFYLYGRGLNKYLKKPDTINQRLCLSLSLSACVCNTKKYPFSIFGRLQRKEPFEEFMTSSEGRFQLLFLFSRLSEFSKKHLQCLVQYSKQELQVWNWSYWWFLFSCTLPFKLHKTLSYCWKLGIVLAAAEKETSQVCFLARRFLRWYLKQIRRQVTQKPTGWKWFSGPSPTHHGHQKNGVGRRLLWAAERRQQQQNWSGADDLREIEQNAKYERIPCLEALVECNFEPKWFQKFMKCDIFTLCCSQAISVPNEGGQIQ